MHSSFSLVHALFVALVLISLTRVSAEARNEAALPCYESQCSKLIAVLKECQVNVDASTGNINFPVGANSTGDTDKCICRQQIVDAYDPCFICGAENQKIQDRFSTQKLVSSCNINFGATTVRMPGSGSSSLRLGSSSLSFVLAGVVTLGATCLLAVL